MYAKATIPVEYFVHSIGIGGSVVPEAILTGHVESVVCVDLSASLALVVSGAKREPHRTLYVYTTVIFYF